MKSFLIVFALLLFPLCIYATDTDGFVGGGWLPAQFAPPGDIDEALPHYIVPKSVCVRYTNTISGYDKNGLQSELLIKFAGGKIGYDFDPGDDLYQIVCNTKIYFKALGIDSWIGMDKDKGLWLIFNVAPGSKVTETDTVLEQEKFEVNEMSLFPGATIKIDKYLVITI